VPGAETAKQPCSQECGEGRAPGAGTAMRPYQQNLMERGVSKEQGEERAPELRLNCELSVLGAEWQKLARAPTLQLKLVSWKLKFRLSWNYEVNMFGLTVQERYVDKTVYEKGRGNSDTNRMVRRRKTMEEKEVTRKESKSSRQLQKKQSDESGIYKLDQTGVGGGSDSTFWEKITRFMRYEVEIWHNICRQVCTLGDMHKKPDSASIGGSEEQRGTSVIYTHTVDCNITQSHTETYSEYFKL